MDKKSVVKKTARHESPSLEGIAQCIKSTATWNDLPVPRNTVTKLKGICNQVKRSRRVSSRKSPPDQGLIMLLTGPCGTGKTLTAEVIANELKMNLYRVDLSAVVSKYIGETEKNLDRIFSEADISNAVLFFDEADARFGKRSEVRDSHDRYADMEINYLLQLVEDFCGLAILATNMKSSLDQAFLRRLRFIVNVPFPSPEERKSVWRDVIPDDAPDESARSS